MEFDYTTLLYIVFGLIYFLFTGATRKRKGQQKRPPTGRPDDTRETVGPPPIKRQPTFEELLEEFTGGKPRPAAEEEPIYEPEPVVEVQQVEPVKSKFQQIYEERREEIEARNKRETEVSQDFSRFREFESSEPEPSVYAKLLKEPDGPKKAFVMSEIFKRKF